MTYVQVINGTSGVDILFGGTGNDLLTGGGGSDVFVISKGYGSDTVSDFQAGAGGDVLRVQNYGFATFANFLAAAHQVGSDIVVTLSTSETLTLQNVTLSSFTAENVALDNPLPTSGAINNTGGVAPANTTLTTGAMNDSLQAGGTGVTLVGGTGDDTYYVYDHNTKIIEQVNAGIDTVVDWSYDGYNLAGAPNVENLRLTGSLSAPASGNDLNNIIIGNSGNNVINGGGGNDVLTGGAGSDTFVIATGNGNDIITDFKTGAGGDILQLNRTDFKTLADVTAAMKQVGTDAVLTLASGETITLENASVQNFTTANVTITSLPTELIQTFNDDFNSLSAGQDPHLMWRTSYAWSGTASYTLAGEQEVYVDPSFTGLPGTQSSTALGLNPFSIQDGHLVITAQPIPASDAAYVGNHPFSSGMISTENSFVQTYGVFEMNATLPNTTGAWPAFWMLPINTHGLNTELDPLEAFGQDSDRVHWGFRSSTTATQGYWADTSDLTVGEHTFAVEWTPYSLTYFVDGIEVGQEATPADMNTAMYMIANLAMGGSWVGNADPTTTATMTIDSIKAYQLPEYTLAHYTLLTSGVAANTITGTAAADILVGTSGNDLIDGAGGADTMSGGAGDDTYIVSDTNAKIVEGYGGGVDTVKSSVTYTLPDYVENLTLTGSAAINATGNSQSNIIIGNDAANVITGGLGNDILTGGGGADTFVVNSGDGSDIITDFAPGSAAGHDVVQLNGFAFTSFSDIQAAMTQVGSDVYLALTSQDTLVFRNTTVAAFTGDDFQLPPTLPIGGTITSWISGNASSRIVYGTAANDKITAVNSDDTLVGWTGDDTYVINNPNQKIVENPGGGIDSVEAWSSYTLPANVENLTLMTGGLTGIGNELANRIAGSSGDDILNGGGGNDWIFGGAGNDTFVYLAASGNVTIADFHVLTSTGAEHDKLILKGYDAGAYLTNVGDQWTVHYAAGTDTLRIVGVTQLSSSDFSFVSTSSTTTTTMSMAALTAPTISLAGGGLANGGITNANHLTLTGLAQAGVTISIFDQTTKIGTATADATGASSFCTATLSDGTHMFTAIAADGSGDLSSSSTNVGITVDTIAPTAPSVTSFAPDSNVAGDGVTNANQVVLTGTGDVGSTVRIYDGTIQVGTATVDASGNWTFATGTLADGTHAFASKAVDAAGNVSGTSAALNVTVDTVAPRAPTLVSDVLADGNSLSISGTAEASATIKLYEGTTLLGTGVADSHGTWNINIGSLAAGAYALTASATDAAGNVSNLSNVMDPVIGTVIESSGSTSLVGFGNNFYLDSNSSGSGPELKYAGAAVVAGHFGSGWTPIGAEQTSTGYEVAWKNTSTGLYTVWSTDSNGNLISSIGGVSRASAALESAETSFHQDLNGDGVINTASTVLEISGNVSLTLSKMTQAVKIDAGATLELTGAVSGSITFNASTGNLVLDHASQFTGTLINLSGDGTASNSNQIDLKDISYAAGTSESYSGNATGGVLTVVDSQNHAAHISLVGDYTQSTFNLSSDGHGGTLVIDPPMNGFDFSPVSAHGAVPASAPVVAARLGSDGFVFDRAEAFGSVTGAGVEGINAHRGQLTLVEGTFRSEFDHQPELFHFAALVDTHLADFHNFMLHA